MKPVPTTSTNPSADSTADLERGRAHHAQRAWASAYEALVRADRVSPIGTEDLERLALCAYLTGRDDEYLSLLKRAFHASLAEGATARAARSAFWLGLRLMFRGESGQSRGWLSRAERLLASEEGESLERGYLLLAATQLQFGAGDLEAAGVSARRALSIGERFAEADLIATARHLLGHVELQLGKIGAGLAFFDETLVAAAGGELSPLVTGLVFCSVIEGCQDVYALDRAQEWTRALAAWCDGQAEMVAFAGICSVHRAELLQLHGAWTEAFAEAERAVSRCARINRRATGAAHYQRGELCRLRGEFERAEDAYRCASELGWEPQPGLALLRLAQARVAAAVGSIVPVLEATSEPSRRARFLPAYVEIMLAHGEREGAGKASRELAVLAERYDSVVLRALAAQAKGEVLLAEADALAALRALREAQGLWERIEAPYAAARVRVLIARCCSALADDDGERLESAAARAIFERLGARLDVARPGHGSVRDSSIKAPGLTAREREVLRLVATGRTNKLIAKALSLSEKTVERHVSNICTKLDVSSRTAATAYAYQHHLL